MDIFLPVRFRTQVQLAPSVITNGNLDELIREKIQKGLEGRCSRHGYIRPDSIEIVRRSMGCLMKAHFNGHIRYDVICKADVCNPVRGMVFRAIVKNKNELGILAEGHVIVDGNRMPVLDVLVPKRSAGITSELDLDTVDVGDEIFVEVLGKRYQLHDKKISIIARAVNEPPKRKLKEVDRDKSGLFDYDDIAGGNISNDESESYGGSDNESGTSDSEESDKEVDEDDDEDDDDDGVLGGDDDDIDNCNDEPDEANGGELAGGIIMDDDF